MPVERWAIPAAWTWTTLGRIFPISSGTTPSRTRHEYFGGSTIWVKTTDLNNGIVTTSEELLTPDAMRDCALRVYPKDTVCIAMYGGAGTIGKTGILGVAAAINQSVCALVPNLAAALPSFVHLYVKSIRDTWMEFAAGLRVAANINAGAVRDMAIPLPPLAEQKRIVARVDQLMALIDDLEAKQIKKRDLSTRFTKASLEALTSADSPEAFDTAWQRVLENFPTVVDRAEELTDLRRCVVGLALRGCLLPQRPSDGDAAQLLARLNAEPLVEAERPGVPLPATWRWLPLESVLTDGPKNGFSPKGVDYETPVKSLTLTATTSGKFDGQFFKYIAEDIPIDSELWLRDGDVLIQRGNTIEYVGVAAIYRGPSRTFIYPDLMMKVRISAEMDLDFVHMALNSPVARAFIMGRASGTSGSMPKINQATLRAIPIPVAPLAEQRRVMAKVEHLMKLCDDLEAKLRRAEDRASKLVEAVVQEMVA